MFELPSALRNAYSDVPPGAAGVGVPLVNTPEAVALVPMKVAGG